MNQMTAMQDTPRSKRRFSGLQVLAIVLISIVLAMGLTFFTLKYYFFPKEFTPVTLSAREEQVLNAKMDRLGHGTGAGHSRSSGTEEPLDPEVYSEAGAKREISLSEKELNALLAKNTDLARKLAIDLSDDLISIKLLVPLDEDFPVMGGQTIKIKAGVATSFQDSRPVVVLKGASLMGVPIPNAWLGNLKDIDLVKHYSDRTGFWKTLADGIDNLRVEDGRLTVMLKE